MGWKPTSTSSSGASPNDALIWRPLLDDAGTIIVDDEGAAVMGIGPA